MTSIANLEQRIRLAIPGLMDWVVIEAVEAVQSHPNPSGELDRLLRYATRPSVHDPGGYLLTCARRSSAPTTN